MRTIGAVLISLWLCSCGATPQLPSETQDINPVALSQVLHTEYLKPSGDRNIPVLLSRESGAGSVNTTLVIDEVEIAILHAHQSIRVYLAAGAYSFRFVPNKGDPGEAYAQFPVLVDPSVDNKFLFYVDEKGPRLVKLPAEKAQP